MFKKILIKYLGFIISLPIFINFSLNFIGNPKSISFVNLKEFISSILLFTFLFTVGKSFKDATNKKFTATFGIIAYFISFFIFESIFLFFIKDINLHNTFIYVNVFWMIFLIFKLNNKYLILFNLSTYLILRVFNSFYFLKFIKNKNIEGDVKDVFFLNTEKIYNESLFYSISNPVMSGYPQFMSYIDAFLYKLSFYGESYSFMIPTTFVFLWLFILMFIEFEYSSENKIALVLLFTSLILNSQWLEFLFLSSLMSERIASYLFLGLLININKVKNEKESLILFSTFLFSFIYLTKQFFALLLLVIFIYYLSNKNLRKYSTFLLFAYFLRELQHLFYFKNIPKDHHISQIDLFDTALDLILLRDLKINNINLILQNLLKDKPVVYLIILFFISYFCYYFIFKDFTNFNSALLILSVLNFIFVFLLYISVWQTMELESPIRYFYSFIPVYSIAIFFNLEKIQNLFKNY